LACLGRILIIDDENELMSTLCELLANQGYATTGLTEGAQALEALAEQDFDIILTDLMMPGMDGIELLSKAQKIDPNIICIIMTGQGTVQTAVQSMKLGAFDYILKPFKINVLLPVLVRAMEMGRLRKENLQLRETMAIYELSKAISFTLDMNTILNKVSDAVLQQCEADEMSIMLPTDSGDELYVATVRGENREGILGERVSINKGIAGWVACHRETLTLRGEVDDPRFASLKPRPDIKFSVSMPMLTGGKLVGILNVNSKRKKSFSLGKIKALSIFASTAASALENARLYKEVQKAEEKYRSIFANSVEGIFQSTPEGRLITVNPAMARILGYDSAEQLLRNEYVLTKQDYWGKYQQLLEKQSDLRGFEHQIYRHDQSVLWVSVNVRGVHEDDRLLYYEGTFEDITERKKAEVILVKSRNFYLSLFEEFPNLIWCSGSDSKCFYFNKSLLKFTGKTIGQAAGDFWPQVIHPNDLNHFLTTYHSAFDARKSFELELRFLHCLDGYRWIAIFGRPFNDLEGKFAGYIGSCYDITDRRKTQEELKQSYLKLKSVLEETVEALSYSVEIKDQYTAGHQRGVAKLALAIAEKMGLTEKQAEGIYIAGILHDIGKISIPSEILSKPGLINEIEFNLIKTHPQVGSDILKNISFNWPISMIVLQHHERINGKGYPLGLTGENILMEAKILAVADVVEAMSSHRPYRPALGIEKALEEIATNKGILYEPEVVEACLELFQKEGFEF